MSMNAISEKEIVKLWLEYCYADSTRKAYKAEWQRFQRYCKEHQLSCALKEIRPKAISSFVNRLNSRFAMASQGTSFQTTVILEKVTSTVDTFTVESL